MARAGDGAHTNRTYFDRPSTGPYQVAPKYKNPWTGKVFGIPFCHTDEERYERFAKKYQIAQAQHQVRLDRLNWDAYEDHLNPSHNSLAGFVGKCDCRDADSCHKGCGHGCGKGCGHSCGKGCGHSCKGEKCCGKGCGHKCSGERMACDKCGKGNRGCDGHGGRGHGYCHNGRCSGYGNGYGNGLTAGPYQYGHMAYPAMNREDAVRYIEGFQYYPPYHTLRSPRDFYMWDVTHGLGR